MSVFLFSNSDENDLSWIHTTALAQNQRQDLLQTQDSPLNSAGMPSLEPSPSVFSASPSPTSFPPSPPTVAELSHCNLPLAYLCLDTVSAPSRRPSTTFSAPSVQTFMDNRVFGNTSDQPTMFENQDSALSWPCDITASQTGCFPQNSQPPPQFLSANENFYSREISEPPSPAIPSLVPCVTSSVLHPSSQHRRALSDSYPNEYDRRFSEGDVMGHLLPDNSKNFLMSCYSQQGMDATVAANASPSSLEFWRSQNQASQSITTSLSDTTSAGTSDGGPGSSSSSAVGGAYRCEYEGCTKSFSRPYNLSSHIRTHTNLRPFKCDYCDRQFARLHDMNRHARLHRGVRPFSCERCQHQFARMDALNRHLKVEGGRNLCNLFLIQNNSPNAMPLVDLPPKKVNPLILAHFPNFGQPSQDDDSREQR